VRSRLYVHVVWTTRCRARLIDSSIARFLTEFLPAVARQERAQVLELGIVRTHVHVLLRLHPMTAIPRLVQRLKGGSSVVAGQIGARAGFPQLRWARGYALQSVSPSRIEAAREYVRSQQLRHPDEAIRL
jgi:REP element-mobilizing transposase RayT